MESKSMDNKQEIFAIFDQGYNEGYLQAAQEVASAVLRLINTNTSWMLEPERRVAKASVKLATKHLLKKRKLIPYDYDVMMGRAEKVELDFDIQ